MKKISIPALLILISQIAVGQFKSATIGIDGLTCSMCSYSVEKSIRKLTFVDKVKVDLNGTVATIEFKSEGNVDMRRLMKSVSEAGFSVRNLSAKFDFGKSVKIKDNFFQFGNNVYILLEPANSSQQEGVREVKFIEKTFSENATYKKHRSIIEKSSTDSFTNASYYVLVI